LNTTGLFHRIYILWCDPESLSEGGGIALKRCLPTAATGRSSSRRRNETANETAEAVWDSCGYVDDED